MGLMLSLPISRTIWNISQVLVLMYILQMQY